MKKLNLTLLVFVFLFSLTQAQQSNVGFGQSAKSGPGTEYRFVWFNSASTKEYYNANFILENELKIRNPELFKKNNDGKFILNFNNFRGSPYESNEYLFGHVTDEISQKSVNLFLRYNVYNDIIELKASLEKDEKTIALLKKGDISCVINGKTYNYFNFTNEEGVNKDGYLKLIHKGTNFSLYKRLTARFKAKEMGDNSYKKQKPATFSKRTSYYLKQGNKVTFLPKKKKALLNNFPSLSKTLKTYLSKVHPNLKNEKDLVSLVKFLDSNN